MSGPDLIDVCANLDRFAGEPLKLGKRSVENEAVRAMRTVRWHWRCVLGTWPGEGKHDVAALTILLSGLGIRDVVDRENDDALHAYVRSLLTSAKNSAPAVDPPSARDEIIAKAANARKR